MSQAETPTDHDVIRKWIESRQGRPTKVAGTESNDGEGILRIDFREPDDKLEPINWDEFFETFEDRKLAFLHQYKTADVKTSRFFKFGHLGLSEKPIVRSAVPAGGANTPDQYVNAKTCCTLVTPSDRPLSRLKLLLHHQPGVMEHRHDPHVCLGGRWYSASARGDCATPSPQ